MTPKETTTVAELVESDGISGDANQGKVFDLNKAEFAQFQEVPRRRIDWRGLRLWAQPVSGDPIIEACSCNCSPKLGQHFHVSFRE
jgi:hypothetical protein